MARSDIVFPFDISTVLSMLDGVVETAHVAALPSAGSAWDAAWIACLTNSPIWAVTALDEFRKLMAELGLPLGDAVPRDRGLSTAA